MPTAEKKLVPVVSVLSTTLSVLEYTVIEIESLPELPVKSLTLAVIVWVPGKRVEMVRGLPVPKGPSMFEFQLTEDRRSPSSASFALTVNVMGSPPLKLERSITVSMLTTGLLS